MSIFTPTIYNEPSFSGLFRLLDDFDNYRASTASQNNNNNNQQQQQQISAGGNSNNSNVNQRQLASGRGGGFLGQVSAFTPRFDLRETDTAFELHGDLPGVEKDQVHVEFADEHTLTIRGRVEREWKSSSSSSSSNDNDTTTTTTTAAMDKAGEEKQGDNKETTTAAAEKQASSSTGSLQQTQPQAKYWITERSVGEFSRSFRLTGHHSHRNGGGEADVEIDHDGVTAKLDNGVLSVVVPKVVREKKQAKRKVLIN